MTEAEDYSAPGASGLFGDPLFAAQEPVLRRVLSGLELPDPFSVLDLGCGTGRMYDVLRDALPGRKFSYDGVDRAPERLTAFHDRLWEEREVKARPPRDWVALFPWTAERFLDWAGDGVWDLVVVVELLMHLPPEEAAALVGRTRGRSMYLVTCDWDTPMQVPIARGNYLHDYEAILPPHARFAAGTHQSVRVARW